MIELSIRFTSDESDQSSPISVSHFYPSAGTTTDPVPFTPPLDDGVLDDLHWYVEVFPSWPTGPDYERAERIEVKMEEWGRDLLESITADRNSAQLWRQFADEAAEGKLLTIDATDPRVLRLPWELLADESGHLFTQGISIRRRLRQVVNTPTRTMALPVRVLVVVSRPDDAGFIDPRVVSLPLLNALDELGEGVTVEFLYPPTLKALSARLRDREAPPVHLVHFDGHGVYDASLGLGYLLFENEQHRGDRVDANRLGTLLNHVGVPLMVLNACQSAKQEETNPYASVAARLIRAGVGSVLAMNYSLLVPTAHRFVESFYGGLVDGLSVGQAVDGGRVALLADEERHTLTRRNEQGELVVETITLRDWFLPSIYQRAADPVLFRRDGGGAGGAVQRLIPAALTNPDVPGGLPANPNHGFHGRSREMLRLERALATHAIIVLHGFGGFGKTTLAAEAGRWFYRTGRFPGGAALVSFEHGGSLELLCSWVGQAVSGNPNWVLGEGNPVERVANLLRERPALVILDNFESVLGSDPVMPPEELQEVLDAVWSWAGAGAAQPNTGSRILITTRDTAFNDTRFRPSRVCTYIELEGLPQEEALELAAAILDDNGIDRTRVNREALIELMMSLGGHPLSLNLVLPHLREFAPAELSRRFEQLLPGFTTGAAKERNESLAISLEFSLRRLGEATRAALPDLAIFQGGAFEDDLLEITQIDSALWQSARAEMEQAALVKPEFVPGVRHPFLRFHPTLLPYLASRLSAERRAELEERFWLRYYAVASFLYESDSQYPQQARAIALRELPNLRHAVDLAMARASLFSQEQEAATAAINFVVALASFLRSFGRWREQDVLMAKVAGLQVAEGGTLTSAAFGLQLQQGETLLHQGLGLEAEQVFRGLLLKLEEGMVQGAGNYEHAITLAALGNSLGAQHRNTEALKWYRRALEVFESLSQEGSRDARQMAGLVHTGLADLYTRVGRFDEAEQEYKAALLIDDELGDERGKAVDLGQLGNLALARRDLSEAKRLHGDALRMYQRLDEPQAEAATWHQLGTVAQAAKEWDEAERCYRQSLRLEETLGNWLGTAKTCNQLGIIANLAGHFSDAEQWYLRAQAIKDRINPQDATTLNNLAHLYLQQGRLDEAERYAQRAVAIKEHQDASASPWTTYDILGRIATARGDTKGAAQWRRKEQESYIAYEGSRHRILGLQPLIQLIVAACNGSSEASERLETVLQQLEDHGGHGTEFARAARLILGGERNQERLTENVGGTSAVLIHAILAQLSGEAPPASVQASNPDETPEITAEANSTSFIERVRQKFTSVVHTIVAATLGNAEAAAQLEPLLKDWDSTEEWAALAGVLRRILAGERDPQALLPGLDHTDTIIVADVLTALGVSLPQPDEPDEQGMSLDDLLELVAQACQPSAPADLAARLHALTRSLSNQAELPAEIRAFARVLNEILSGERNPDLATLPEELADRVRALLEKLEDEDNPH